MQLVTSVPGRFAPITLMHTGSSPGARPTILFDLYESMEGAGHLISRSGSCGRICPRCTGTSMSDTMDVPSKPTISDPSPFGPAGGTLAAGRADAGVISRRTGGPACRWPRKLPESAGVGSK